MTFENVPISDVQIKADKTKISTIGFGSIDIKMVDMKASDSTKSLFAFLKGITGKNILFGHQHDTTQGLTTNGNIDGTQSDTYNSVGAFPAVYGWDTLSLHGWEEPYTVAATVEVMKKAYKRGGVITLSAHMMNFVTDKDFYDTSGNVVEEILPNGREHAKFNAYLDMIAKLANQLIDDQGEKIPVIFRPFHENSGDWFWWGAAHCTEHQFKHLFRYTVEYLRDTKKVNNFLYAYSPNGLFSGKEDVYLSRYPGDEYIDIVGFDIYDNSLKESWMHSVAEDCAMLARIAEARGKISALTEVGVATSLKVEGNLNKNWYMDLLNRLKNDPDARKITYMMVWRNGDFNGFWIPYKNHPLAGNHEMLEEFISFYNDRYIAFNDRLESVYNISAVRTIPWKPFMYIVSPTGDENILGETTIKVKVINYDNTVDRVTYTTFVEGVAISNETDLILNELYYEGIWSPSAAAYHQSVEVKVKIYYNDAMTQESTVKVYCEEGILVTR